MSETFTPHPGGRIDRAQNAEAQSATVYAVEGQYSAAMSPVPVTGTPRAANGDTAVYRTMTIPASSSTAMQYRQLIPQDMQRYRAVVLAQQPVVLCDTKELAQNNGNLAANANYQGFYVSAGVTIELRNKGLVYAVNPGTVSALVSVAVERYEDPEPS